TAVTGRGLEALATATERVEGARLGEISRADAELAAIRAYEVLGAGLTLGLGLILIALLVPSASGESPAAQASDEATTLREVTHVAPLPAPAAETRDAPPTPAVAETPAPRRAEAPAPAAQPVQVDRRKAPELRAAADLCTDFARLVDATEMPALLDRAAKLLDATGFIVWMAEPGGEHLRPVLAHGYPPQALARLPALPRHADNATAAAYRHAEMQIVRTNGMSAEVRHGREAS
nr:hypothetical protein [Vicinamibacterales bacterium]